MTRPPQVSPELHASNPGSFDLRSRLGCACRGVGPKPEGVAVGPQVVGQVLQEVHVDGVNVVKRDHEV